MEIIRKSKTTEFKTVAGGVAFVYEENVYIKCKTDATDWGIGQAMSVRDGCIVKFCNDDMVQVVKAKLYIE